MKQELSFEWFLDNVHDTVALNNWWRNVLISSSVYYDVLYLEAKIKPCFSNGQMFGKPLGVGDWEATYVFPKPVMQSADSEAYDNMLAVVENILAYCNGDVIHLNEPKPAFGGIVKSNYWISSENQDAVNSRLERSFNDELAEDMMSILDVKIPTSFYSARYKPVPENELESVINSIIEFFIRSKEYPSSEWIVPIATITQGLIKDICASKCVDSFATRFDFHTTDNRVVSVTVPDAMFR